VRDHISNQLRQVLEEKGFIVLNWGDAGWVYFFVQKPTASINDIRDMKLFVTSGDPAAVDLAKDAGFHPVPLAVTDVLPALQTGMINAFDVTPLAALSMQWFASCKYMIDIKWAPLTGATVISKKAWDRIPADLQPKLMEAAQEAGKKLRSEIRRLEKDAVDAMVKRGLQVVPVSPEMEKEWRQTAEKLYPRIRTDLVPSEYFDQVMKLRDEYRASKGK
jgi:TRAP-type C4-dicarboxylate transport system substrate-binding protein